MNRFPYFPETKITGFSEVYWQEAVKSRSRITADITVSLNIVKKWQNLRAPMPL